MSSKDDAEALGEIFARMFTSSAGEAWEEYQEFRDNGRTIVTSEWNVKMPPKYGCSDGCDRQDGIAVLTIDMPPDNCGNLNERARLERNNGVLIVAVSDHHNEYIPVTLDIETAKKFVNALGSAIGLVEARPK